MSNIKNELKYWGQIFSVPLYYLSHLMPRDNNIWVLGSTFGKRFSDNPRYFYLYLNQNKANEVKAVWISKEKEVVELLHRKGYPAYYLYSMKGLWYSLRAKVYLYDNYSKDICFLLSGGAVKVNMWHGIPLKKINMDNIFDKVRHPKNWREKIHWALRRMSDEKPSHYVLTTSSFLEPIFSSAFATNNVIVKGYPRNDILVQKNNENLLTVNEQKVLSIIEVEKKKKKIALYMPTFRDSEEDFFEVMDLKKFVDFLKKEDIFFCVKLHPKSKLKDKFKNIDADNILIIETFNDPYSMLSSVDVLVTDYSSIYFDFLLCDKPIIFFHYDLEKYLNESRELYFDYNEYTPGFKVDTMEKLMKALIEEDSYEEKRKKIKEKMFENQEESSSEQLFQYIKNLINKR